VTAVDVSAGTDTLRQCDLNDLTQLLQLRFDFDSTGVRRPFDCLSKVIKVTVT